MAAVDGPVIPSYTEAYLMGDKQSGTGYAGSRASTERYQSPGAGRKGGYAKKYVDQGSPLVSHDRNRVGGPDQSCMGGAARWGLHVVPGRWWEVLRDPRRDASPRVACPSMLSRPISRMASALCRQQRGPISCLEGGALGFWRSTPIPARMLAV